MAEFLNELNKAQREAAQHVNGPLMVIAGPGSGKTRVLTYRVAHLIQSGIAPWNILALTFTNKAAKEMKERIESVVGSQANKVWAGTFHSIFARILRIEASRIGYPGNFTIYDKDDTRSVLNDIIKEMSLDKNAYNVSAISSRISSAKSNIISPKAYAKDADLIEQDRMHRRPLLYQIYQKYTARCERAGAMDFDDLLYQMFKLLNTNPDNVLEKYQRAFQFVLVDEFQDTNYLQYAIVKKLVKYEGSPENICVVGDDAQSIYAFRGATIQNILQFQQDFPSSELYKLEQNYRSTNYIIQAANEVITHNSRQISKVIWTQLGEGQKIKVVKAMSDGEEGRRIANMIVEQKNRYHLSNRDVAILYRTNAQSRVFEEHLRRHNIPYRVFGGLSFYQRKEVKDVLAYMRLATNARDDEAFKRIVNYPKRGIGQSTVSKLALYADETDLPLLKAVDTVELPARAKNLLLQFKALISSFTKKASTDNAYDAAYQIAHKSGVISNLKSENTMDAMGRLENINALLDGVQEFVEQDEAVDETAATLDRTLPSYLQSIALLTDQDEVETDSDFVTLMSVHAAKGLEFESIFVVGLEENLFPSYLSMSAPDQLEEERRLFYVAITRAKKHLTLSYANTRYHFGQMRFNDPSRFLSEISDENFESLSTVREPISQLHMPKVLGGIKRLKAPPRNPVVDPETFSPSPSNSIGVGMKVLHLKFGEGEVKKIDGNRENRVATIHFSDIENPERRIMLRFAKLQII